MEILYRSDEIAGRIAAMGAEITEYYRGKELTLVTLMTGGLCFAAALDRFARGGQLPGVPEHGRA